MGTSLVVEDPWEIKTLIKRSEISFCSKFNKGENETLVETLDIDLLRNLKSYLLLFKFLGYKIGSVIYVKIIHLH